MEQEYLNLLRDVREHGEERRDRTGVGTKSVFGRQIRGHLSDGFPLLTTKKVGFKAVAGELLWFLEGSGDERRLAEITYGTRDPAQKTIWSPNAEYTTGSKFKPQYPGDLGRVYGVQWRSWIHHEIDYSEMRPSISESKIDQIADILDKIKNKPADRRMILTAWNPGELDEMALPPCHLMAQFHVNESKDELDCQVYIRSNDLFLGLPFNIASYALLIHLMARATDLFPGELIITIGDAHIYLNHLDQVKEQLSRTILPPPTLWIDPRICEIDKFQIQDFVIKDYASHDSIKAQMAV